MTDKEPFIFRSFLLNDLVDNCNKVWKVKWWPDGTMITFWCRVGSKEMSKSKQGVSQAEVEKLIYQKVRTGYHELKLHQPVAIASGSAVATSGDPKVDRLVQLIYSEAGETIKSYLAQPVDSLSTDQIQKGRSILARIGGMKNGNGNYSIDGARTAINLMQEFFQTIPTKLPSKMDKGKLIVDFLKELSVHENRLDQLESALATYTAVAGGASQQSALGGVEFKPLDPSSKQFAAILDMITKTNGKRYGSKAPIVEIFTVKIPSERAAFEAETQGKGNIKTLFHGTANANVRHILKSGLTVPAHAANGRRLGDGIYFADRFERSYAYCTGGKHPETMMFLCDVALGKSYVTSGTYDGRAAPVGYDSTHGTGSWSGTGDEFVVYKRSQQTLRAIILIR